MDQDVTFRRASSGDLDTLVEFRRELCVHDDMAFDEQATREAFWGLFRDDGRGCAWMIESDGAPVGYVVLCCGYSIEFQGVDAFLDELFITHANRGRGIGRKAIRLVEEECRARRIRAIHLEVERDNLTAQELYRKCGFLDHDR